MIKLGPSLLSNNEKSVTKPNYSPIKIDLVSSSPIPAENMAKLNLTEIEKIRYDETDYHHVELFRKVGMTAKQYK